MSHTEPEHNRPPEGDEPDEPFPIACCAHRNVIYVRIEHEGGTCSDSWECADCKTKFWPDAALAAERDNAKTWWLVAKGKEDAYVRMDSELFDEREKVENLHTVLSKKRTEIKDLKQQLATAQHDAELKEELALAKSQIENHDATIAQVRLNEQHKCKPLVDALKFFKSVIQSGESWTVTCQKAYDDALELVKETK